MISPLTIKYESPNQSPHVIQIETSANLTKIKEVMRNFLAKKHQNDLTLFDLDVFTMLFYRSLRPGEIKQLTYELKNSPNQTHSITINSCTDLHEDGLFFSESDLVNSTECTEPASEKLDIPIPLPRPTDRKVCRSVLSASFEESSEYNTTRKNVFSFETVNSSKDSMLLAFFNSQNLLKITLRDLEYEGSDIVEYTIDSEAPERCTIS